MFRIVFCWLICWDGSDCMLVLIVAIAGIVEGVSTREMGERERAESLDVLRLGLQ